MNKYEAGAEYQLAQRILRDCDPLGPDGEKVILARAYMAVIEGLLAADEPTEKMVKAGAFFEPTGERAYSDAEVRNIYLDMRAAA